VVEKRLLFPPRSTHHLHVVIEQEPLARNRIALSPDRADVFGSPLATIDWRVGETAAHHSIALTKHFLQFWANSVLSPLARLELEPTPKIVDGLKSDGSVYHSGGSTRMGRSASEAVADANLRHPQPQYSRHIDLSDRRRQESDYDAADGRFPARGSTPRFTMTKLKAGSI